MPFEPLDAKYRGEVAERYRYRDGEGEIGVIASVTQPFCGDCTRARLSAEGELYTCLFADHGTTCAGPYVAGQPTGDRGAARVGLESAGGSVLGDPDIADRAVRKVEMSRIGG